MSLEPSNTSPEGYKKVALITGSATGIGANISIDLALAGYHVILTGRNVEKLNKVAKQCGGADVFVADLYDLKQVDCLIEFVHKKFNRLDILVNNACWRGNTQNILDDGAYQELEKVMHLNLSIPLYLVHKCLMPLKLGCSERPIVLNISSIASQRVVPLHLYSISKTCLSEMSKQLAQMSSTLGILSITVSPGPVLTNERPHHKSLSRKTLVNRVATTQEISDFVTFIISRAHLFNGKELVIDGGVLAKSLDDDSYRLQGVSPNQS